MTFTRRQTLTLGAGAFVAASLGGPLAALAQTIDTAALADSGSDLEEMVLGAEDAPVTVIEYASMTCGHCASFHTLTYPALKEKYIDTGKVRFVMREFPLDPLAAAAFMLARCAPGGRYFETVDLFFERQADWTQTNDPLGEMLKLAKQAGFTQAEFEGCLTNQQLLDGINAVKDRGADAFGVSSTPTFFINGEMLRGAQGIGAFEQRIDPLLEG